MTTPKTNLPAERPASLSVQAASTDWSESLRRVTEDLSNPPENRVGCPVTARIKVEAERALESLDRALAPAPRPVAAKWLAALGSVMPHSPNAAPFDERLRAMLPLVEFPASCYTDETLKLAARTCRFFPSIAELTTLFDPMLADLREQRRRLARVAATPLSPVKPGRIRTEIERHRQAEAMQAARRAIEAGQAETDRFRKIEAEAAKRPPVHIGNPILDEHVAKARGGDAAQPEAADHEEAETAPQSPALKPVGPLMVDWLNEAANG